MRFVFQLANAAGNNVEGARLREQTRLGCLALALERLGHEVAIANVSPVLVNSHRWAWFKHLENSHWGSDHETVLVIPAEDLKKSSRPRGWSRVVAVKCSVNCRNDARFLAAADLVVAHEYDVKLQDNPRLLPVPFIAHDLNIDYMMREGLFNAYICDEVEELRKFFAVPESAKSSWKAGFCGVGHFGRKELAEQMPWCEFKFADTPVLLGKDYLSWLMRFEAGVNFHGDTPKTNRFSELVMLGRAVVSVKCPVKVTPEVDETNSVMLRTWDDEEGFLAGLGRREEIVMEADRCYREGWSPMGQAKLIVERLGVA